MNLLKRAADAGQLKRALFLCDRDELRTQALRAFQNVFGADAAEVYRHSDGVNNAKNARILCATYQTLGIDSEDGDQSLLTSFYPPNYFTHVVIDECHRSAWGKWSEVLTRNASAAQVGLTATPRQLAEAIRKDAEKVLEYPAHAAPAPEELRKAAESGKSRKDKPRKEARSGKAWNELAKDAEICADNYKYFGDPVYEYDMAQAIEDGYLTACAIERGRVNVDETGITNPSHPFTNLVNMICEEYGTPGGEKNPNQKMQPTK